MVIAAVVAAAVLALTDPFASKGASPASGVQDNTYPTSQQTVSEQTISSQDQVSGTLGYASSYEIVNQAQGTFTTVPKVGDVMRAGAVLYRASDQPVILLYGHTPAYRALAEGLSGPDVKELNANLVSLGYATSAELDPTSDYFGYETAYALEHLQKHLGATETGSLAAGPGGLSAPGAAHHQRQRHARHRRRPRAGRPGDLHHRQVTVELDAAQQSEVKVGDKVTITLPDNSTTPGIVSAVGKVATTPSDNGVGGAARRPSPSRSRRPTRPPPASLDQAPVQVAITTATRQHALVVPVDALLALANGGYAVEVVGPSGAHSLVPVSLGLFDDADGLVQVSGQGLTAGQHVVVPGS